MIGGKDIVFECQLAPESVDTVKQIILGYWPHANIVEEINVSLSERQFFFYRDKAAFDRWAVDGATPDLSNTMIHLIFMPGSVTAVVDDDEDPMIKGMLKAISEMIEVEGKDKLTP
jgi:hypothetical protein